MKGTDASDEIMVRILKESYTTDKLVEEEVTNLQRFESLFHGRVKNPIGLCKLIAEYAGTDIAHARKWLNEKKVMRTAYLVDFEKASEAFEELDKELGRCQEYQN